MSPLKVSQGVTGRERFPGNIISKQNLDIILQKNYLGVFHELPERGPLRSSRGFWGGRSLGHAALTQ
jgi:hypothetical protein